jgi:F0F1-type ATP synthase assembly protein I
MSTLHEPAMHAPTSTKGEQTPSSFDPQKTNDMRRQFSIYALNMSWRLAIAVLVPVIGGAELDKKLNTSPRYVFIGLGIALVASIFVLWKTMQAVSSLPVPKLTDAQKKAIKKSYEEEDEE